MAIKIRRGLEADRTSVIFEEGEVLYTTDTKSFFIGDGVTAGGNQIGGTTAAELLKTEVHNATGATLTAGQVVYLSGNTGNKPNAVLAKADAEATSSKTIGLIILNIANNANGDIATDGLLSDIDTSAFAPGDLLWLSDSIAGGVTTVAPDTPNHAVFIGYVVAAHPTQGKILIHIQNGYELNELHDVKITSVANGDVLGYDSTLGYWVNKTPSTPTLAQVTSAGNTTTNAISVGGLTVDTDTLFVDATNNRVGIGTVTPSQPLHIIGRTRIASSTGTSLHLYNDGTTSYIDSLTSGNAAHDLRISAQNISFYSGASYGTVYAKLFNTGNFALGSNPTDAGYKLDVNGTARVQDRLSIVKNEASTFDGVSVQNTNSVYTTVFRAKDNSTGVCEFGLGGTTSPFPNDAFFYTNKSNLDFYANADRKLRIFGSTGNVLIQNGGTYTDAGYRLDVNGTVRIQGDISLITKDANSNTRLQVSNISTGSQASAEFWLTSNGGTASWSKFSSNRTTYKIQKANDAGLYNGTAGDITFLNDVSTGKILFSAGGSATAQVTLFSNGNIGINTTTDAGYRLDVNGTVRVQNGLDVNNQAITNIGALSNSSNLRLDASGTIGVIRIGANQVGIGNNSIGDTSAILTLISTTRGFLPPRMTTTQKNAISTPAAGLVVYDTTLNKLCVYTSAWETITSI